MRGEGRCRTGGAGYGREGRRSASRRGRRGSDVGEITGAGDVVIGEQVLDGIEVLHAVQWGGDAGWRRRIAEKLDKVVFGGRAGEAAGEGVDLHVFQERVRESQHRRREEDVRVEILVEGLRGTVADRVKVFEADVPRAVSGVQVARG